MEDIILSRTSVREYQDIPVEAEKVQRLLQAAMAAPSARNQQPWEFAVITDPQMREALGSVTPYTKPALSAPLLIVPLSRTQGLTAPDFWQQDMAAATENLLVEAVALGLGTVWMGIAPNEDRMEAVAEIIGLPEGIRPFCIIAAGYPKGPVTPKDKFQQSRIHYNGY